MLQEIDKLEWDCPCADCQARINSSRMVGEVAGRTLYIAEQDDPECYWSVDLPPGVVLAQEVDGPASAPADPFMPSEWPYAEYVWVTHNADGEIIYWQSAPSVAGDEWLPWSEDDDYLAVGIRDMTGLDWRNSLRHRPQ